MIEGHNNLGKILQREHCDDSWFTVDLLGRVGLHEWVLQPSMILNEASQNVSGTVEATVVCGVWKMRQMEDSW